MKKVKKVTKHALLNPYTVYYETIGNKQVKDLIVGGNQTSGPLYNLLDLISRHLNNQEQGMAVDHQPEKKR